MERLRNALIFCFLFCAAVAWKVYSSEVFIDKCEPAYAQRKWDERFAAAKVDADRVHLVKAQLQIFYAAYTKGVYYVGF